METLVVVLVLVITVAYAVFIAVSIEKGKAWAYEIARAISMLDPQSVSFDLHQRARESVASRAAPKPDGAAAGTGAKDRLAA